MSKLFGFLFLSLMIQYSMQADDPKAKFKEAAKSCQQAHIKTAEDSASLSKVSPTAPVKDFFQCMAKAFNFVNSDGSPIPDAIKNYLIAMKIPAAMAENLIKACVKTSPTPSDSAFDIATCMKKAATGMAGGIKPTLI